MTGVRSLTPRQWAIDVGLASAVAAVGVAELWVPFTSVEGTGSRPLATITVIAVCTALVFRRAAPLPATAAVLIAWPLASAFQPVPVVFWGAFVPMVVAVFSVARHGRGREPVYGALAGAATLLFMDLRVEELQEPGEIVFHWMVFTLAWTIGRGLQVAERRAADSLRRAVDAEVAAAEQAMAAVLEERTRIARELHDVVAHSVSMMVVQAGAAEQVVGEDDEHVRRTLATIRATGTEALGEMRRVVAMLRETDEAGALAPQPGLDQFESLVEEARATGLDVTLRVSGTTRDLPAGLDLAAYRIVQEALTNVRRHAAASTAEVNVGYADDKLILEVIDDGVGGSPTRSSGHGLIGMRERAALYGGQVDVGPRPEGGFRVYAELPLARAEVSL
jgi:signal transduction histidine kinase